MSIAQPSEICTQKSPYAQLTFSQLTEAYEAAGKPLSPGFEEELVLITSKGAFNLLAFLLSDQNDQPLVINRYSGFDKNISIDAIRYEGSLVKALADLLKFIHRENQIRSKGFQRGVNVQVEEEVLDAALINAVAHNDWVGCGAPVVDIFCNRYEIISFGMEALAADAACAPVWPELMRVLVDLGYAQGTGAGLPLVVEACGSQALTSPAFGVNVVELPFVLNTLYSGKFAAPMMDSVERLCDVMGDEPRTAEDLMYLMQEAMYSELMGRYVEPALERGAIERVGQSEDTRKQVYRRL